MPSFSSLSLSYMLTVGVLFMVVDPTPWALLAASITTPISVVLVAMIGAKKLNQASEKQKEIHTLVNSNMQKMFIALGASFLCIFGLVWYGLKEASKASTLKGRENDKP